jgi:MFS transporter, DHA2 family, multidrug resistance protein
LRKPTVIQHGLMPLAAINTVLNDRMDLHPARLHEAVNWSQEPATETLSRFSSNFQGSNAQLMALKQMMGIVRQQASVMSIADVFCILTVLFVGLAALGVIMRRPQPGAAAAESH